MATKPTIVFVPGSFAPAGFYNDNVKAPLLAKGYDIEVLQYPSIGRKEGLPTMLDDAAYIAAAVTKLADEGKDVVLIAHSYGGMPTTQSIKGLSKAERQKSGKRGGVVRIGYMTALAGSVGMSLGGLMAEQLSGSGPQYIAVQEASKTITHLHRRSARQPIANVKQDGWMEQTDHKLAAEIVFSDWPLEKGIEFAKQFSQHSSASFATELSYPGYSDVPVSYLFCEKDKCVPPSVQQSCIDAIERASGNKVDVVKIPNDHCPNLSAPEKTIDWIVEVVNKSL